MRILFIMMLITAIVTSGCSKKKTQPQQTPQNTTAPVTINKVGAALTPEIARSPERVLVENIFTCADRTSFTARFKQSEMELISGGWKAPVVLPQDTVATGFWYHNAQYDLRGKGQQAVLTIQGHKPITCTATRR